MCDWISSLWIAVLAGKLLQFLMNFLINTAVMMVRFIVFQSILDMIMMPMLNGMSSNLAVLSITRQLQVEMVGQAR